jgi:hypothetical protein
LTARRLWNAYIEVSRADARIRWGSFAAAILVIAASIFVPMLLVLLAVAAGGTYAVLRSPLFRDAWVGKDADDWA